MTKQSFPSSVKGITSNWKFVVVCLDGPICRSIVEERGFHSFSADEVFEKMFDGEWELFKETLLFHNGRRDRRFYESGHEVTERWDFIREHIADTITTVADIRFEHYRFKNWLSNYVAIFEFHYEQPTANYNNRRR